MLKPFDLLESVLVDIEKGIRTSINSDILAEKYELSERHLRRLFRFAFNQSISGYIRSRKLTASLEELLKSDDKILKICLDYGFDYEQSYIRTFKREFGITPGELRKNKQGVKNTPPFHLVKIKPPIHLSVENKIDDGVIFGPDIVMVPQFHLIGKLHHIPSSDSLYLAPKAGLQFWINERLKINEAGKSGTYYGLTKIMNPKDWACEYLASVQVKNFDNIPVGLTAYTFEASMCVRFRYIGQHHLYDINQTFAVEVYNAIRKLTQDEVTKYIVLNERIYFEKVAVAKGQYGGDYYQMEWFIPMVEKGVTS
jgi:AraC family transcriptional regulator